MPFDTTHDLIVTVFTRQGGNLHAVALTDQTLSTTRIAGGKVGGVSCRQQELKVTRDSLLAALPDEWKTAVYKHTGEMARGYSEGAPCYDGIERATNAI